MLCAITLGCRCRLLATLICSLSPAAAFGCLAALRLFDLSHGGHNGVCLINRFISYTHARRRATMIWTFAIPMPKIRWMQLIVRIEIGCETAHYGCVPHRSGRQHVGMDRGRRSPRCPLRPMTNPRPLQSVRAATYECRGAIRCLQFQRNLLGVEVDREDRHHDAVVDVDDLGRVADPRGESCEMWMSPVTSPRFTKAPIVGDVLAIRCRSPAGRCCAELPRIRSQSTSVRSNSRTVLPNRPG